MQRYTGRVRADMSAKNTLLVNDKTVSFFLYVETYLICFSFVCKKSPPKKKKISPSTRPSGKYIHLEDIMVLQSDNVRECHTCERNLNMHLHNIKSVFRLRFQRRRMLVFLYPSLKNYKSYESGNKSLVKVQTSVRFLIMHLLVKSACRYDLQFRRGPLCREM
jgi:hypothetical protein